uniref:Uncharacterized protein n=1 Tax=Arundo donax TaxID=35708 RepID=A0A0A9A3M3_ARUDO
MRALVCHHQIRGNSRQRAQLQPCSSCSFSNSCRTPSAHRAMGIEVSRCAGSELEL